MSPKVAMGIASYMINFARKTKFFGHNSSTNNSRVKVSGINYIDSCTKWGISADSLSSQIFLTRGTNTFVQFFGYVRRICSRLRLFAFFFLQL